MQSALESPDPFSTCTIRVHLSSLHPVHLKGGPQPRRMSGDRGAISDICMTFGPLSLLSGRQTPPAMADVVRPRGGWVR